MKDFERWFVARINELTTAREAAKENTMSPLQSFIRFEMKRVMANVKRAHPDADELAVRLIIVDQLKTLELAEVQPEDERKTG